MCTDPDPRRERRSSRSAGRAWGAAARGERVPALASGGLRSGGVRRGAGAPERTGGRRYTADSESDGSRVRLVLADVRVENIWARPTPGVEVVLSHPAGRTAVKCTPDTGAEATVMGAEMAASLGITSGMLSPVTESANFTSAGRTPLTCVGMFEATVALGTSLTNTAVYVLREVPGFLLGWRDSISMRILPEDFPAQIPAQVAACQKEAGISHLDSPAAIQNDCQNRPRETTRPPAPPRAAEDGFTAPPADVTSTGTARPPAPPRAAEDGFTAPPADVTSTGTARPPAPPRAAEDGFTAPPAGVTSTGTARPPAPPRAAEDGFTAPPAGVTSGHELVAPSADETGARLAAVGSPDPETPSHSPESLLVWDHDHDPPPKIVREHEAALLSCFRNVIDGEQTLREMAGGPMEIELTDDAEPSAVTAARTILYCRQEDVKKQLDDLQAKGIIEPVDHPTEWAHPLVPVAKKGGGVRPCVDLTRLNKFVKRPTYPTRPVNDAVAGIPGKRAG